MRATRSHSHSTHTHSPLRIQHPDTLGQHRPTSSERRAHRDGMGDDGDSRRTSVNDARRSRFTRAELRMQVWAWFWFFGKRSSFENMMGLCILKPGPRRKLASSGRERKGRERKRHTLSARQFSAPPRAGQRLRPGDVRIPATSESEFRDTSPQLEGYST